jgi:acyl-CoA synthetase (AMP-forming)/AMP-acid ligase II/thioesterase domain-containing protein/acyl carrier protein
MIVHGSLHAIVRSHAALRPGSTALLGADGSVCSYHDLTTHLDRVSTALAGLAPAGNPVIAVAAESRPNLFTAIVAAMSSGICVPFDAGQPATEIEAFLSDVTPSLVLADDAAIERHSDLFRRRGIGVVRIIAAPGAPAGVFDVVALEPQPHRESVRVSGYDADIALLLRTSGTTASSKLVAYTEARLMRIITSIVDAIELQPDDRCLNAMPFQHVWTISWVIGASLVAGASVATPANIGAAALVEGLRRYKPTWYAAPPTTHRDILACVRSETRPFDRSLRFIRTLGAPIDVQLVIDLEAALGAPVLDGYGSTEAPCCAFNLPLTNRHGSVGRAVDCEIAIFDGEVALRGAKVAPSYAGGEPIADPVSGWYRTGDAGYLDADGYLYITGRLNERINVGGIKVSPATVETALRAHPDVEDAVAFPLPHPTLGEHVAAAAVRRAGAKTTETELIEYAVARLPRAAVPNVIYFVPSIARDGSGKVRRHELTRTFARDPAGARLDVARTKDSSILHALSRIWEDVLEYAPVALDENFFAAGGDSLRAVRVMMRIEADLGVTMSMDTLLVSPTIVTLAQAVLDQAASERPKRRIVPLRTTGSRPPLYFYDGDTNGGGLYTRILPAVLDEEQPIYLVRPNGALGDNILESIERMADADAAMIAAEGPAPAYRLGGFCSGGNIALEVARRLEAAGARVDVIALIGSSAPNARLELLWALTSRVAPLISEQGAAFVYRCARSLVNSVRTRAVPAEFRKLVEWFEHRSRGLPLYRPTLDFIMYRERLTRYFPKRYDRTVDLIWADDDPPLITGDPTMGWRHVARVRRHAVRGDHTTMLTDHVADLGAALRRILDAADKSSSGL